MWDHGDFNGDGSINVADLLAIGYNWGATADWYEGDGAGAMPLNFFGFVAIPEPSTFLSILLGMLLLLGYRGRSTS